MNILTGKLPESITIDGIEYPIRSDFKNWIDIHIILYDDKRNLASRCAELLSRCFIKLPPNLSLAISAIIDFATASEVMPTVRKSHPQEVHKRQFSFLHDANYIYAAFWSQYSIDLQAVNLHWWQFLALFNGLDDNCKFSKIIAYRTVDIKKIKDKEQKTFYKNMKRLYALPDNRTIEEKDRDMINELEKLF